MIKTLQIILAIAISVAICNAEAPQSRSNRFNSRSRFFARQEVADDAQAAVTPYPSASELKPEVPFQEGSQRTGKNIPDETYGPPDAVYGPPETNGLSSSVPVASDLEVESEDVEIEDQPEDGQQQEEEVQSERLTIGRNTNRRRLQPIRSAKLQSAPQEALAPQPQYIAQPIFFAGAPFAYSAQYRIW